jgi:hypothetical protein
MGAKALDIGKESNELSLNGRGFTESLMLRSGTEAADRVEQCAEQSCNTGTTTLVRIE